MWLWLWLWLLFDDDDVNVPGKREEESSLGVADLEAAAISASGGTWILASVTCGWKCGKECGGPGSGWWAISCWRSAHSGSEGTSQTAMPASRRAIETPNNSIRIALRCFHC